MVDHFFVGEFEVKFSLLLDLAQYHVYQFLDFFVLMVFYCLRQPSEHLHYFEENASSFKLGIHLTNIAIL